MAVDNPRGGTCTETLHSVKTLNKALEWCESCTDSDLPIKIYQQSAGGRLRVRIFNKDDKLISSVG